MAAMNKMQPALKDNPALELAAIVLMTPFLMLLFPVGLALTGVVMLGCVLAAPFIIFWRLLVRMGLMRRWYDRT
jgi:hypothetical protein